MPINGNISIVNLLSRCLTEFREYYNVFDWLKPETLFPLLFAIMSLFLIILGGGRFRGYIMITIIVYINVVLTSIYNKYIIGNFGGTMSPGEIIAMEMMTTILGEHEDTNIIAEETKENVIVNDTQNVHDTSVTSCFKHSVDKLVNKRETKNKLDINNCISEIINCNNNNNETIKYILEEIKYRRGGNDYIKELDLLAMVWERINHPTNIKNFEKLKDELIRQLLDCISENGQLVCVTGRMTRILQSLELLDVEEIVSIRPLWAVKNEIAHVCCLFRCKILNKFGNEKLSDNYNNDKNKILTKSVNNIIRRELKRKFKKDYVKSGLLKQEKLNEILKPYLDVFD